MGKFIARPNGAAPLFDSNSGKAAARKRWDAAREAAENAVVVFANAHNEDNDNHTVQEAYDFVVRQPQFKASMEGKTAAAKFVSQMGDLLPAGGSDKPTVVEDNRQVHFHIFELDRETALRYIEDLRNEGEDGVAEIVKAQISDGEGPFKITVPIEND
jgi:hypothetical protein